MISTRYVNFIALLFLMLIGSIFIYSCKYFTEPELSNSNNAKPTQYKQYAHINYQKDTLCGGIFIRFKPDESATEIKRLDFFIDSLQVSFITSVKFEYFIETKSYQIGKHDLVFVVYKDYSNSNLGLMNMFGEPSVIYSQPLVFANNPIPNAPTNARSTWIYQIDPFITWSYSDSDSLADYFIVERVGPTRFTDTIYNIKSRFYKDTTISDGDVPGYPILYKLGAANRFGINYVDCK